MEKITNLITVLEQCIPQLDSGPLYENLPTDIEQMTILDWLYHHLNEQKLMAYEEWSEYNGYLPELTPLAHISLTEEPANFIFNQIEGIDWSAASIDPYELPYMLPWLEHINCYLKPHNLRLVSLLPFENAYIICVRDNEALLEQLDASLAALGVGIGINLSPAMDRQQVAEYFASILAA